MLQNKVAIVTGSSRGIGKAIALRLAAEGAKVVVNGRDRARLEPVTQEIRAIGGTALAVEADVSQAADVDSLFQRATEQFGAVDILVNNAALTKTRGHFLDVTEEWWDQIIANNLKSVYLCSHRAATIMAERGGGSIVNISSAAARSAHRINVPYVASKGAIEAATRAMALDLAPYRIRVNAVGPAAVLVESWGDNLSAAAIDRHKATVPLGRVGTPADVAGIVAFFVSDDAAFITGQVIYVDGGLTAQLRCPQVDGGVVRTPVLGVNP